MHKRFVSMTRDTWELANVQTGTWRFSIHDISARWSAQHVQSLVLSSPEHACCHEDMANDVQLFLSRPKFQACSSCQMVYMGTTPIILRLQAIAFRLEAIASRLEAANVLIALIVVTEAGTGKAWCHRSSELLATSIADIFGKREVSETSTSPLDLRVLHLQLRHICPIPRISWTIWIDSGACVSCRKDVAYVVQNEGFLLHVFQ